MAAIILDGKKIAAEIKAEIAGEVRRLGASGGPPGLAVVLAGSNPASEIYVRNKVKACEEVGIHSEKLTFPDTVTTSELLETVEVLNGRDDIDGILVQLPLPDGTDASRILAAIDPSKDVDGTHPMNVGYLATRRPGLVPCTPSGIIEILRRSNIRMEGAEAVVVGRSELVGKPISMLLTNENATVTLCHSKTRNLAEICRRADILIAAIGKTGLITGEYVKPGATVIDVGINRVTDRAEFERLFGKVPGSERRKVNFEAKGSTVVGDVHPEVMQVAGAITPVPGGVGPLTIAMLIVNTLKAYRLRRAKELEQVSC